MREELVVTQGVGITETFEDYKTEIDGFGGSWDWEKIVVSIHKWCPSTNGVWGV